MISPVRREPGASKPKLANAGSSWCLSARANGSSAIAAVGNAVEGFARALATEIKPRRINVVSPGMIDTPMIGGEGEARVQQMARMTANNLIPRIGTADEVADAILFLIRNDFVTGTTVDVDGGALLP